MTGMTRTTFVAFVFALAGSLMAADPAAPAIAKTFDQDLKMIEGEVVSLAEAMPAGKYDFAPTQGEFAKARTFGQQVGHIAAVVNAAAASLLGDKAYDMGKSENGPAGLKTKDDLVKYLKESFANGHKAIATLTDQNLSEMIPSPFGRQNKVPRVSMATAPVWHSFDHYGQMVVYARMNGVVPPASR